MSLKIEKKKLGKLDIIQCQVGEYIARFAPEVGGNIIGFRHQSKKINILHEPSTENYLRKAVCLFGMPVLFPPNRIDQGRFEFDGRKYQFPIGDTMGQNSLHGFVQDAPWNLEDIRIIDEKIQIVMTYEHHKDQPAYAYYPHTLQFTNTYELSRQGLVQKMNVQNTSKVKAPFMLGYHTAFDISQIKKVMLNLEARIPVDQRMLPTGEILPLNHNEEKVKMVGHQLDFENMDHLYALDLNLENNDHHGAVLTTLSGDEIIYGFDKQYPYVMLWNNKINKKYVCIEPQTCIINAPNINKIPSGMITLNPGQCFEAVNTLTVVDKV